MMNLLKQNSIRLLSGLLTAAAVASCQIPESERIPSVFEIQPSSISALALGAGVEVSVRCDLHWTAELEDPSWAGLEVTSVKDGEGGTLRIKCAANTAEQARENTLVVKAGKSEQRIPLTQGGLDSFFSPRTLQFRDPGRYTVSFHSPSAWTARLATGGDWLSLKTTGGASGDASLVCTAGEENVGLGSRTASIELTIGTNLLVIEVEQVQKDVILADEDELSFSFEEQAFSVKTQYNVAYQIRTSADWIQPAKVKAPLSEGEESFTLTENEGADERKARIEFTSEGHPDASFTISVTQEGKDPILNITQPGFYGIGQTSYIKGVDGWNQSSISLDEYGDIRYRLFNAASLSVITITGPDDDLEWGERCTLNLVLNQKGILSPTQNFVTHLIYSKDHLLWFKGDNGTYFIMEN